MCVLGGGGRNWENLPHRDQPTVLLQAVHCPHRDSVQGPRAPS